jgi:hypothetical protein
MPYFSDTVVTKAEAAVLAIEAEAKQRAPATTRPRKQNHRCEAFADANIAGQIAPPMPPRANTEAQLRTRTAWAAHRL